MHFHFLNSDFKESYAFIACFLWKILFLLKRMSSSNVFFPLMKASQPSVMEKTRLLNSGRECDMLRSPTGLSFFEDGKCSVVPTQPGQDQVTEIKSTHIVCCSHQSVGPMQICHWVLLTRPEITPHRMTDDHFRLSHIYLCLFCPLRSLRPARKILPHHFCVYWVPQLPDYVFTFGIYVFSVEFVLIYIQNFSGSTLNNICHSTNLKTEILSIIDCIFGFFCG